MSSQQDIGSPSSINPAVGNDQRLLDQQFFCYFVDEHVRFSDTDALGHVNNAVYATYFAAARIIVDDLVRRELPARQYIVPVARISIDFRSELHFPNALRVGSALLRIGRSSFVIGQGLWTTDQKLIATSEVTHVLVNRKNGLSTPLPAALRDSLSKSVGHSK